jgi:hypothetical protein
MLSPDEDNRYYEYLNNRYNREELALITGYGISTITDRINDGWDIIGLISVPEGAVGSEHMMKAETP